MISIFTIKPEWRDIILLLPVIGTLLEAASLFLLKGKSKAKISLAIMLSVVCICIAADFVHIYLLNTPPYCIFQFYHIFTGLIITPLVLFYFTTLISPQKRCDKMMFYAYLPAAVLLVIYFLVSLNFDTYPETYTWASFRAVLWNPEPLVRFVALCCFGGEIIVFLFLIWRMVKNYRSGLSKNYSYSDRINLRWVNYIIILLLWFGIAAIFALVSPLLETRLLFSATTFVIMFFIFILGYNQPDVPDIELSLEPEAFDNADHNLLLSKIEKCMQERQLYLKQNLSLHDLAIEINTNRSYVSKAINAGHVSFYSYVNKYRIEHAQKLLDKVRGRPLKLSLVSKMCGFKSYSIFCRLFKEKTGCLPGAYLKKKQKFILIADKK